MSVAFVYHEDKLTAYIQGELDHHAAKGIRQHIDGEVIRRKPKTLYLDFSKVSFMDSSGIGLVMGRFKVMSEWGGIIVIQNPPPSIKKVMQVAGLGKLAKIITAPVYNTVEIVKKTAKDIKEDKKNEATEESNNKSDKGSISQPVTE
ncbi:MAG: anti-sigma factor antagonist [Clostridiales bacterium]|nr:anti-sigma factor antagonist [Clostridiales bacterium]